MVKAYVDTSVLTDVLLKCGQAKMAALAALARFDVTELPVYAIKEFKAGPLKNYKWFHNKLVETKSLTQAMTALHSMSRSPHRYITSTALEASIKACDSIASHTPQSLLDKYGASNMDDILCEEYRLAIKATIMKGWAKRRCVTTHVVQPLTCYQETEPYLKRGLIELDPMRCDKGKDCCLGKALKQKPDDLTKMRDAISQNGATNAENIRRRQVLGDIARLPKLQITEKVCKSLGDALFAFFAPADAKILTTNLKDHQPLAESLGKQAERP